MMKILFIVSWIVKFLTVYKRKKARYGIKLFELTTPDGYVLNVQIYKRKAD